MMGDLLHMSTRDITGRMLNAGSAIVDFGRRVILVTLLGKAIAQISIAMSRSWLENELVYIV